jgi:outer membrane biosynthesis protein TonB
VLISFSIKPDGSVCDFNLYEGCGDISLNNEALRVTKMAALQNTWFPAINSEGEKINSIMTNTIIFGIQ